MMRSRPLHKLRSYLLPAIAAIFLAVGPIACSSSGEDGAPNPALEGAAAGEESSSGNANAASSENSNAAATNANTESSNTAKPEGESAAANNPIGNELNNAIANDKGGGNGANSEEGGGAINSEANGSAAANPAGGGEAPVAAADANAGNPFAAPANNATPANAAPADLGAAAAPPADVGAAPAPAPAPADAGAAAAPVDAGAAAAPADAGASASASSPSAAAAPSGPTSLPEMGSKMAYYVMRGDTLGAIAQKIYGSRKKWKALQSENGLADANKIYPGDVIYFTLNESSKAFAEKYEVGNRQAHTVVKGDTLARLAAKFYGTQGAWRALWKENPQVLNPDRLRVGTVLSYRAVTKVALKDEEEDQEKDASEDQSAANESGDESGVAMAEPVDGQFTAAVE